MELTTSPIGTLAETVDSPLIIYGAFINYDGELESFEYEVDATIQTNLETRPLWEYVVNFYNNKLIDMRGLSRYKTMNHLEISCNQFEIKASEPFIKVKESFSPCYGTDIRGCLESSLQHEMCQVIFNTGSGCSDAKVRLKPVMSPMGGHKLNLITFGDSGFEIIRGNLYYEFYPDRNSSCATCAEGLNRYNEAIGKINSFLIANTDKAVFKGNYIHDFKIKTDKDITDTIYETFYTIIELAKIKTIRFEREK